MGWDGMGGGLTHVPSGAVWFGINRIAMTRSAWMLPTVALWLSILSPLVYAAAPCRFAPLYDANELFSSTALQDEFIQTNMQREGRFLQPNPCPAPTATDSASGATPDLTSVGYHAATGMTLDGHRWTVAGGLPLGEPHLFTAASKESLHLAMLAQALNGNLYAQLFISPDDPSQAISIALATLALKVNTIDSFHEAFPGFGGFLPWVYVSDAGLIPTNDFNTSVPSLDNGQMFWGAFAVANVLQENYSHVLHTPLKIDQESSTRSDDLYTSPSSTLAARWTNLVQRMIDNALIVFYDPQTNSTTGQFRTVSVIVDRLRPIDPKEDPAVAARNYHAVPGSTQGYLNDPYEGELFTNMVYLFGNWSWTGASPASLWVYKRAMLEAADLTGIPDPTNPQGPTRTLTVEKGYWHSGHEKWKFWLMPYTVSSWSHRILVAGEKARTWFSFLHKIPSGFASAAGLAATDTADGGYHNDCGIESLAFEPVSNTDIITPYAWAALSLVSRPHALAWFHNHISAPRAQTCFGVLEALNRTGEGFAPVGTWDTKITTMVAWIGGINDIVTRVLERTPVDMAGVHGSDGAVLGVAQPTNIASALDLFQWVLDVEWGRVFGNGRMQGEDLPFQRPTVPVPDVMDPWPSCTATSAECQCTAGWKADNKKAETIAPKKSHPHVKIALA